MKKVVGLFLAVFVLMQSGVSGVLAQTPTLDQVVARLSALESENQKLRKEVLKLKEAQLMQKQISAPMAQQVMDPSQSAQPTSGKNIGPVNVDYVGRYNSDSEKGGLVLKEHSGFAEVTVGGYVDMEFENFQNTTSTFDQHRWILNVNAQIGERLRFASEYEIEHGGPDAAGGGGSAKVEAAYIDFLINDAINLRSGALLVPFGRYNLYHDSDLNDLTDRPLVNRDIIPTTWTEAGAGIFGEFNPSFGDYEDLVVSYEAYMINGLDAGFSDTGLRGGRSSLSADNNNDKAIVGRVVLSPSVGHELGISGYYGDFNTEDDAIRAVGVDFLTTWGPWEFLGEWAYFDVEDSASSGGVAEFLHGFYVQANYHFWFDFLDDSFLGRTFEDPTFTLVGRYGQARIGDDGDATIGENKERRWTLGINYRPVESWVLKLEYQNNHGGPERLERGDNEGFIASVAMGF